MAQPDTKQGVKAPVGGGLSPAHVLPVLPIVGERCPKCAGSGRIPGGRICGFCGGTGHLSKAGA